MLFKMDKEQKPTCIHKMKREEGIHYCDKNLTKISKGKDRLCSINNQTVMRVSRIITTQYEEVDYFPLPEHIMLTHSNKVYDYKIKYTGRGNTLEWSLNKQNYNKPEVKSIKAFDKNECDEPEWRFISKKASKPKYQVVKMSFLETCRKLFNDMAWSSADHYDKDSMTLCSYIEDFFKKTKHEETDIKDDISENDFYKLIQEVL